MCAEADWRECHRQVIAQELMIHHGIITAHIMRDGKIELHPEDHLLPLHYGMMAPSTQATCCVKGSGGYGEAVEVQLAQLHIEDAVPDAAGSEDPHASPKAEATETRRWGVPSASHAGAASEISAVTGGEALPTASGGQQARVRR